MQRELRDQWVAALRSGEYPQGTDRLRTVGSVSDQDTTYCCLGVLGCLLVAQGIAEWAPGWPDLIDIRPDSQSAEPYAWRSWSVIPESLASTIGLYSEVQGILQRLNDNGAAFATIAAEIEALVPVED